MLFFAFAFGFVAATALAVYLNWDARAWYNKNILPIVEKLRTK